MAIKDWKRKAMADWVKKFDKRPAMQWIKKDKKIGIIKLLNNKWDFRWVGGKNVTKAKNFKTKQEALEYAKEYMRKH